MERDEELNNAIAPDVLVALRRERFFETLDDRMCPADPTRLRAPCDATYAMTTAILVKPHSTKRRSAMSCWCSLQKVPAVTARFYSTLPRRVVSNPNTGRIGPPKHRFITRTCSCILDKRLRAVQRGATH